MNKRWILSAFAGAALAVTLMSCGGSDNAEEAASDVATTVATAAAQAAESVTGGATATATTAPTPAGPQLINLKAADYLFDPKELAARPGAISVTLSNDGPERPHSFAVKKLDGSGDIVRSERVAVGQSMTIDFTITEPGTYEVYCPLPGHADRGQTGTLTVQALG